MAEETKKPSIKEKLFYSLQFVPYIGLPLTLARAIIRKPSPIDNHNWKAYVYVGAYSITIAPAFHLIKEGLIKLIGN